MAGFANDLALQPLGDLEERGHNDSPPPYSVATTRFVSPFPLSEQQRLREERLYKLETQRLASCPDEQFTAQHQEETKRLWDAHPRRREMSPSAAFREDEVYESVKNCWIEQGIWKNEWNDEYQPYGPWKHEEPLEFESESHSEAESSVPISVFGPPQRKRRQPKSIEEIGRMAERRVVREREREASRPYHQFIYQVSKERERIENKSTSIEGTWTANINTTAYESIKNTWIKREIWNPRWGILPGMSWKHEEPLEEEADKDPVPVQNAPAVNPEVAEEDDAED